MALILRNGGSQSPDRWLREPRNNQAVSEDQKYYMLSVSYECSFLKHEFGNETYRKYLWEEFIRENVANYCIYTKDTNEFVGYCGIKNLTQEIPELAIELLSKYRKIDMDFKHYFCLWINFRRLQESMFSVAEWK